MFMSVDTSMAGRLATLQRCTTGWLPSMSTTVHCARCSATWRNAMAGRRSAHDGVSKPRPALRPSWIGPEALY